MNSCYRLSSIGSCSSPTRTIFRCTLVLVSLLAPIGSVNALPIPIHGRFLADAPFAIPNTTLTIDQYSANGLTQFDNYVFDPFTHRNAGSAKFDYDTISLNNGTYGGAALGGGFFLDVDQGFRVIDGFTLAWAQIVLDPQQTGQNDWSLPTSDAGWFPDANPASPAYGFSQLDVVPPSPPGTPTLAFTDDPDRKYASGQNHWLSELALVGISNTPNLKINNQSFTEVRVVDSFIWGFDLNPIAPFDVNDVVANVPHGFSGPSQDPFLNTETAFYDGLGGGPPQVQSHQYAFFSDRQVFVPEPSTFMLLLAGWVSLAWTRRALNYS